MRSIPLIESPLWGRHFLLSLVSIVFLICRESPSFSKSAYDRPGEIVEEFIGRIATHKVEGMPLCVVCNICKYRFDLYGLQSRSFPLEGLKNFYKYQDKKILIIFHLYNKGKNISIFYLGLNLDGIFENDDSRSGYITTYNDAMKQIFELYYSGNLYAEYNSKLVINGSLLLVSMPSSERVGADVRDKITRIIASKNNFQLTECGSGEYGEFD